MENKIDRMRGLLIGAYAFHINNNDILLPAYQYASPFFMKKNRLVLFGIFLVAYDRLSYT